MFFRKKINFLVNYFLKILSSFSIRKGNRTQFYINLLIKIEGNNILRIGIGFIRSFILIFILLMPLLKTETKKNIMIV